MPIVNVLSQSRIHDVMADTWGHLYPEPGHKYYGEMVIARGIYGNLVIIKSDFPGLQSSPQRCELEQTIFDIFDLDIGVYHVKCCLWFYKTSNDMFLGEPIGKIIKIECKEV